ncbi:MAG: YrzE family protein [Pseudomonadota bacterium]
MNTLNSTHLQKGVLIIGLFLIAISLYCSFLLYTSFSEHTVDKAAWGGMGLGLDLFKNVALLAALALWGLGFFAARILSIVVGVGYALLTVLSFMAFFGFMSMVQNKLETQNVLASSKYQSLQGAVDSAEQKVESLSRYAGSSAVAEAKRRLAEVERKLLPIQQGMRPYATPDCTPKRDSRGQPYATRAAEWCSRLETVKAEARPWTDQIHGHEAYLAALAHRQQALNELAALDSGAVTTGSQAVHPMFADLGTLLAKAPDEMKVAFMFVSSASAEILGTLSILISTLLGQRRSYTLDEIEQMTSQLRAQQPKLQAVLERTQTAISEPDAKPASPEAEQVVIPAPTLLYTPALNDAVEAILSGRCVPHTDVLARVYKLSHAQATQCLDMLVQQGHLVKLAPGQYCLSSIREASCNGIEYRQATNPVQVFFSQTQAALPVRLKTGETSWVQWGRRQGESGNLPPGGWANLSEINAGDWNEFKPKPVVVPATRYTLDNPRERRPHWRHLEGSMALQGLMAEAGNERGIYIVTADDRKKPTSLPLPPRPRLINMETRMCA